MLESTKIDFTKTDYLLCNSFVVLLSLEYYIHQFVEEVPKWSPIPEPIELKTNLSFRFQHDIHDHDITQLYIT